MMKVQPKELSVHLGSYPGGGKGDRPDEVWGTMPEKDRLANVRAVTRVKSEQASKEAMQALSLCLTGESRRGHLRQPIDDGGPLAGVLDTARTETLRFNTGDLQRCRGCAWQTGVRPGPKQESEGLVVPMKPVKAGRGKGPWFRVRRTETTVGRMA